jgi:hypothetical protein
LPINPPIYEKKHFTLLLATIWISKSEFVRNEFLLKSYWTNHYESMGLGFPSEPVSGAVWGIWSLCFAIAICIIAKKFSNPKLRISNFEQKTDERNGLLLLPQGEQQVPGSENRQ